MAYDVTKRRPDTFGMKLQTTNATYLELYFDNMSINMLNSTENMELSAERDEQLRTSL